MMDRAGLRELLPGLGEDVVSGSYSPYDGHANPLYLLRALHSGFKAAGGRYLPGHKVSDLTNTDNGVTVATNAGMFSAEKVVIAAGLATQELAAQVGLTVPMRPLHGPDPGNRAHHGPDAVADQSGPPDTGRSDDARLYCRRFRLRHDGSAPTGRAMSR